LWVIVPEWTNLFSCFNLSIINLSASLTYNPLKSYTTSKNLPSSSIGHGTSVSFDNKLLFLQAK